MATTETGALDPERRRLAEIEQGVPWQLWGPYLSERQWATVREDYSADGSAWTYFPHDHARSRAYRWGEDGLLGISDAYGRLCFGLCLWNGQDPILKERPFGLTGPEGNHGEDIKEIIVYEDATPTHAYLRATYRYPQRAFPYGDLVGENARRGRDLPEYEIEDTGVFAEDLFFDVTVEYAKVDPTDLLVRITATNRGPEAASLHLLPTLWFRNRWAWGRPSGERPSISLAGPGLIRTDHDRLGDYWLTWEGEGRALFTENESNAERLWGVPSRTPFVKDGIDDCVVHGRQDRVNRDAIGTKVAIQRIVEIAAGAGHVMHLRLGAHRPPAEPFASADALIRTRKSEADTFYAALAPDDLTADERVLQRAALSGLIWSKQHYEFDVGQWLEGDPAEPPPPPERRNGRNAAWHHLNTNDVILMPDTWEYPWFAAWDLAFHCVTMALIDPALAKRQLLLLTREWLQHSNGQLPAYEWAFGDVNPPVHAWATWRVYTIEQRRTGVADRAFLEGVFLKLLLDFTWWVNRKDRDGRNVFEGGFLGLDNIGVFDRSAPLPGGGTLEQADGTAWMGLYSLSMLRISLELAQEDRVYEDIATKFLEHFLYIARALNSMGDDGVSLWDPEDRFYYDVLRLPGGGAKRIKIRSLVGLLPLLAVEIIEPDELESSPGFARRMGWFLKNRPDLAELVGHFHVPGVGDRRLLSMAPTDRVHDLLVRMFDEERFLGPHGVRSLSRGHLAEPFELHLDGVDFRVDYEPGESRTALFGGNSNWRGPVWFPLNYLIVDALRKFHRYYGPTETFECPTGSGTRMDFSQLADELSRRLVSIFLPGEGGRRPVHGDRELWTSNPLWQDIVPFYEYFHGDTGAGLGASHQTGWTALVASLLEGASER